MKKSIISAILYVVGLILYVIFLSKLNAISSVAHLYGMGASFGAVLFTIAIGLKQKE